MDKYILIKQKRSTIKQPNKIKFLLSSLGLKKTHQRIFVKNNKVTRKMIFKIQHLISIDNNYI